MDQTTFETNSAFYSHNYHEMPERDYSTEMPHKNQGKSDNGSGDGPPNAAYPPLPKKNYSNEISPGKVPTNGTIDGDKLNQLIELINQMPKFNNSPQNGEAQSAMHPHTAMENDINNGNYLVPQLTFGPPNSDTVLVPSQRKKKFAWPKLRRSACQQAACHSNVQLNVCSSRGFGMDMAPRCNCSAYCDLGYYSGDPDKPRGECCLRKICKPQNQMVPKIVMVPYGSSSANANADQESVTPCIVRRNAVATPVSVGVDANINVNDMVDKGMNVDNQNFNTNGNGNNGNSHTNNNNNIAKNNNNANNNNNNNNNGGTCVLAGDVASTVVGLNSIAAINGLCASVNALNGALGGLSGSIGSRSFGVGAGGMNGYIGVNGMNSGVDTIAMNGGGTGDMMSRFSGGASSKMIGRGGYTGGISGGDAFGGTGARSGRAYGGSFSNLNASYLSGRSALEPVMPASYSRYGTSNSGSAYDIRYFESDMEEYRQKVRAAEEDAERRRQELIAERDAEVAKKRQQAEYEVEQETARRRANAEQMRNEEVKKKIANAESTRKHKEQELMKLFCQKLKVLRDAENKRRAQYEKALMEANQRGAPIRQQIALTQRCIQEMEAYKAQIQAQECERKSQLAMLSRQLESICVPAYHADTGSEKNLLAEFCQRLSVIKSEESAEILAAENTPMPTYEIPQMPDIPIPEIPEIQPERVPTPEYRRYRARQPSCQQICVSTPDLPICCPPPQPICCPPQPAYCCAMPTATFGIMPISPVTCYQPPPQPISYYCPPPPCCATYSQPITPEPRSSPCASSSCCTQKPCTRKSAPSSCCTKTTRTPSCCRKTRTAPVRSKSSCCLARKPKDVYSEDELYELQPSEPCRRSGSSCCPSSSCCCRGCGQSCNTRRMTRSSSRASRSYYTPAREVVVCNEETATRAIEEPVEEFKPACEGTHARLDRRSSLGIPSSVNSSIAC
ncbi:hypothetical protein TcWFU_005430 [Taenia crassiceps]|uniref:Uncharacterized protein n=1 Tax=Taenia crassiceps TaxID=6207 RepID=A0ABR4QDF1_9CEST